MAEFEDKLRKACEALTVHGVVLGAKNASGTFEYSNAFGQTSLSPQQGRTKPMATDTVFLLASCTKLVTSIAALQCVQRDLIDLDENVERIVPELTALEILHHLMEDGRPTTKKRNHAITLRHLLSHSSGLGYDLITPKLMRYRRSVGQIPGQGKTLTERFGVPLLFEPGSSWCYSSGVDWAGRIVERLCGQTLEEYFQDNIWKPLGITDMTFFLDSRPAMAARLADACIRDNTSGQAVAYEGDILGQAEEPLGGQGLYGTIPEYMKILHSLLRNDGKLLSRQTTELLFSPQLGEEPRQFLNKLRDTEAWDTFPGHFPGNIELDWGLGGMVMRNTDPGWRRKGTMVWSGFPNLFWFIDREAGLCGIFGTQILPPGDKQTNELITIFEKAMYKLSNAGNPKL